MSEWTGLSFGINPYRQVAIALARWHLMADLLLDLQASHGSMVANPHYGIELGSHGEIPPDVAYKFQNISTRWTELLLPAPSLAQSANVTSSSTRFIARPSRFPQSSQRETSEPIIPPIDRCLRFVNEQVNETIQATFGAGGDLKLSAGQRCRFYAILAGERDVLVVLLTGGGERFW